jgi:hypothetical protein
MSDEHNISKENNSGEMTEIEKKSKREEPDYVAIKFIFSTLFLPNHDQF